MQFPKCQQPITSPLSQTASQLDLIDEAIYHDNNTLASSYDADDQDEPFETTLHIASKGGHENMIDMLLTGGDLAVDETDSDANTALHVAVEGQKLAAVLRLLDYGADPNAENAAGWTPVHLAVRTGSTDIVQALVERGGDLGRMARGRYRGI
jgi:ankyrin repeat protein